jgi:hypothetical protein
MWERLRRRTLGPRLHGSAADRIGLAVATGIIIVVGLAAVVLALLAMR